MSNSTVTIKAYIPYIHGIIGHDFKLTLKQKLNLLFCKRLSVIFIEEKLRDEKV